MMIRIIPVAIVQCQINRQQANKTLWDKFIHTLFFYDLIYIYSGWITFLFSVLNVMTE
jgi:hypothetical protein